MKGKCSIHSHPLVIEEAPLEEGQGLTRVARLEAAGRNADPVGAPCSVPSSLPYTELRGRGAGSGGQAPWDPPSTSQQSALSSASACLGARAPPAQSLSVDLKARRPA